MQEHIRISETRLNENKQVDSYKVQKNVKLKIQPGRTEAKQGINGD